MIRNQKKYFSLLMLIGAMTCAAYAQGDIAPMTINVGFNNGTLLRTDSAALTIWGKTLVLDPAKANTDISAKVDFSISPDQTDYLLWVEKGALVTWFRYNVVDTWADYVFEDTYDLMPLEEVGTFVKINGHLPSVPSVADLEASGGYSMQAIDRITMEKIEELTRYMIDQHKALNKIESKLAESELDALELALRGLEEQIIHPNPDNDE